MEMVCEKCGKNLSATEGEYVFYQERMMFACKACAERMNEEIKRAQRICSAVDSKKNQAEYITKDKDAFEKFLVNIETTLKKIPAVGAILSDIPLLVSLIKSYVSGEYKEVPYNLIVAAIATLLYVISPVDIIPDIIPGVGFLDDAAAVAFCVKMLHDDLENYKMWRDHR